MLLHLQTIAISTNREDVAVVQQPTWNRRGYHRVTVILAPLPEASVGGQQDMTLLVVA